jgi:two-component system cell cycle response regulator DivK
MPGKNILVVEDNELAMTLFHDLLTLEGYAVLKAYDAETAIDLAIKKRPDLIVMDICLPKMDGLAATRLLRADPDLTSVPIIAVTAHARAGDEERALDAGCDKYLSKPFDIYVFLDAVRQLVGEGSGEDNP